MCGNPPSSSLSHEKGSKDDCIKLLEKENQILEEKLEDSNAEVEDLTDANKILRQQIEQQKQQIQKLQREGSSISIGEELESEKRILKEQLQDVTDTSQYLKERYEQVIEANNDLKEANETLKKQLEWTKTQLECKVETEVSSGINISMKLQEEQKIYEAKLESVTGERDTLRKENVCFKKSIEKMVRARENLEAQLAAAQEKLRNVDQQLSEERIRSLESENKESKEKLEMRTQRLETPEQCCNGTGDIEVLKDKVESLQLDISEKEREIEILENQVEMRDIKLGVLKGKVREAGELKERIEDLENELNESLEARSCLEEQIEKLKAHDGTEEGHENDCYQKKINGLLEQLQICQKENVNLKQNIEMMKDENARNDLSNNNNLKLEKMQLKDLEREAGKFDTYKKQIMDFERENRAITTDKEHLESDNKQLESKVEELEKVTKNSNQLISNLGKELEEARSHLKATKDALKSKTSSEEEERRLRLENKNLTSQISSIENEKNVLKDKTETLGKDFLNLKDQLKKEKDSGKIQSDKVRDFEIRLKTIQLRNEKLLSEAENTNQLLSEHEKEKDQLLQHERNLASDNQSLTESLKKLQETCKSLQAESMASHAKEKNLQENLTKQQRELEEARNQMKMLKEKLESRENQNCIEEQLKEENQDLKSQISKMVEFEKLLTERENERDLLSKSERKLAIEIESLTDKLREYQKKCSSFETESKKRNIENESLAKSLEKFKENCHLLETESKDWCESEKKLQRDVKEKQRKFEEVESELNTLKSKLESFDNEYNIGEQLRVENNELRHQISKMAEIQKSIPKLKKEKYELLRTQRSLNSDNQSLCVELKKYQEKCDSLETELKNLRKSEAKLIESVEEHKLKLKEEAENSKILKAKLQSRDIRDEVEQQVRVEKLFDAERKLTTEVGHLNGQLRKYKDKCHLMESESKQLKEIEEKLLERSAEQEKKFEGARDEFKKFKDKFESCGTRDSPEERLRLASEDLESQISRAEELQKMLSRYEKEKDQLLQSERKLSAENESLVKKLAKYQEKYLTLKTEYKSLHTNEKQLEEAFQELEEKLEEARDQVKVLSERPDSSSDPHIEADRKLLSKSKDVKGQLSETEETKSNAPQKENEAIKQLMGRNIKQDLHNYLLPKYDGLKKSHETLARAYEATKNDLFQVKTEFAEREKHLKETIKCQEKKLEVAKSMLKDRVKEHKEDLRKVNDQLQKERENRKEGLEKTDEFLRNINEAKIDNENLMGVVEEMNALLTRRGKEKEQLQHENENLSCQISRAQELEKLLTQRQKELDQLSHREKKLTSQIEALAASVKRYQESGQSLETEHQNLRMNEIKLKDVVKERDEQIREARVELNRMKFRLKSLKNRDNAEEELKNENDLLRSENASMQETIADISAQNEHMIKKLKYRAIRQGLHEQLLLKYENLQDELSREKKEFSKVEKHLRGMICHQGTELGEYEVKAELKNSTGAYEEELQNVKVGLEMEREDCQKQQQMAKEPITRLNSLEFENEKLLSVIEEMEQTIVQHEKEECQLSQTERNLTLDNESLARKLRRSKEECDALEMESQNLQANEEKLKQSIKEQEKELKDTRGQLEILKNQIESFGIQDNVKEHQLHLENSTLKRKLLGLEKTLADLTKQLGQITQPQKANELKEIIKDLERQLNETRSKLSDVTEKYLTASEKVKRHLVKISELESEKRTLSSDIGRLYSSLSQMEKENSELLRNKRNLTGDNEPKELKTFQKENECEVTDKIKAELSNKTKAYEKDLQEDKAQLQRERENCQKQRETAREFISKMNKLEFENEKFLSVIEEMEKTLTQHEKEKRQLSQMERTLTLYNKSLARKLKRSQEKCNALDMELQNLQANYLKLKEKIKGQERDSKDTRGQVEILEIKVELHDTQDNKELLLSENNTLKCKLLGVEQSLANSAKEGRQIEPPQKTNDLKKFMKALGKQLNETRSRLHLETEKYATASKEISEHLLTVSEIESEKEKLVADVGRLESLLGQMKKENFELRQNEGKLTNDINSFSGEFKALQDENQFTQARSKHIQGNTSKQEDSKGSLICKVTDIEEEKQKLSRAVSDLLNNSCMLAARIKSSDQLLNTDVKLKAQDIEHHTERLGGIDDLCERVPKSANSSLNLEERLNEAEEVVEKMTGQATQEWLKARPYQESELSQKVTVESKDKALESTVVKYKEEITLLTCYLDAVVQENDDLKRRVSLKSINDELREKFALNSTNLKEKIAHLEAELQQIRKQNENTKRQLKFTKMKEELKGKFVVQSEELHQNLTSFKNSLKKVQDENKEIKTELEALKQEKHYEEEVKSTIEKEVDSLRQSNMSLQRDLDKLAEENRCITIKLKQACIKKELHEMVLLKYEDMHNSMLSLTSVLDKTKDDITRITKEFQETESIYLDEIRKLKRQLEETKQELQSLENEKQMSDDERKNIQHTLTLRNDALSKDLIDTKDKCESLKINEEMLSREVECLRESNVKSNKENKKLLETLESQRQLISQNAVTAEALQRVKEEYKSLLESEKTLASENSNLREYIGQLEMDNAKLEEDMKVFKMDRKLVMSDITDAREMRKTIAHLESKIGDIEQRNSNLKEQLDMANDKAAGFQVQVSPTIELALLKRTLTGRAKSNRSLF